MAANVMSQKHDKKHCKTNCLVRISSRRPESIGPGAGPALANIVAEVCYLHNVMTRADLKIFFVAHC